MISLKRKSPISKTRSQDKEFVNFMRDRFLKQSTKSAVKTGATSEKTKSPTKE